MGNDSSKSDIFSSEAADGLSEGTNALPGDPAQDSGEPSAAPRDLTGIAEYFATEKSGVTESPAPEESSRDFGDVGEEAAPEAFELPASETGPIAELRNFSENLPIGAPVVQAEFPFSLKIIGELTPAEQEKLTDLLGRENMGIRAIDLEPQFAAGRVLIPRISEFAGVLIAQALRAARVEIILAPSDSVFATEDTASPDQPGSYAKRTTAESKVFGAGSHPAEDIAITTLSVLPEIPHYVVIDVVTASAALKTTAVEAEGSTEYLELMDKLKQELRYKAYRKGATAILNFEISLTPLSGPSHYRLSALGSAVKAVESQHRPES